MTYKDVTVISGKVQFHYEPGEEDTGMLLYLQDCTGFQQDTSNPTKDDNSEPLCLSTAVLPSNGRKDNLLGPHHLTSAVLFQPLTWWDPEPPIRTNGTEWAGGTWLPPLGQDIGDI